MTNSSDRLDRLEAITESNTRNIDILVGIVTGQQQHMATVLDEIRDIKVDIRDIQVEIRDVQATILGLQTENRRILDHLFRQQRNGSDDQPPQ